MQNLSTTNFFVILMTIAIKTQTSVGGSSSVSYSSIRIEDITDTLVGPRKKTVNQREVVIGRQLLGLLHNFQ